MSKFIVVRDNMDDNVVINVDMIKYIEELHENDINNSIIYLNDSDETHLTSKTPVKTIIDKLSRNDYLVKGIGF